MYNGKYGFIQLPSTPADFHAKKVMPAPRAARGAINHWTVFEGVWRVFTFFSVLCDKFIKLVDGMQEKKTFTKAKFIPKYVQKKIASHSGITHSTAS